MKTSSRTVGDVEIVILEGNITIGSGDSQLGEIIQQKISEGKKNIVLEMKGVKKIDSSGIGELVRSHMRVTNAGGSMKLLNLSGKVSDLLQVTRLITVFEVFDDEKQVISSFA